MISIKVENRMVILKISGSGNNQKSSVNVVSTPLRVSDDINRLRKRTNVL